MLHYTPKEQSLLRDLISQEELCIEKYGMYALSAKDGGLSNLFTAIGQVEQRHLDTLRQLSGGTVPPMSGGGTPPAAPSQPAVYARRTGTATAISATTPCPRRSTSPAPTTRRSLSSRTPACGTR